MPITIYSSSAMMLPRRMPQGSISRLPAFTLYGQHSIASADAAGFDGHRRFGIKSPPRGRLATLQR